MSSYTEDKARNLVDSGGIILIKGDKWLVRASDGGAYVVDRSVPKCDCIGFSVRKECSHLKAIGIAIREGRFSR